MFYLIFNPIQSGLFVEWCLSSSESVPNLWCELSVTTDCVSGKKYFEVDRILILILATDLFNFLKYLVTITKEL